LVLAGACATGWGCAPSVTIDAPEIEVTQPALVFPGVPAGTPRGMTVTGLFQISTAKLGAASNPDAGSLQRIERLQVTGLVFKAKSGIADFSFLDHLSITASNWDPTRSASAGMPVITILDYAVPFDVPIGAVLNLPLSPPVNMLPLWGRTILYMNVAASGDLPWAEWSIDVIFSLSVRLTE
jgi:hypothetical protein